MFGDESSMVMLKFIQEIVVLKRGDLSKEEAEQICAQKGGHNIVEWIAAMPSK